jgi:UDP-N-acetylmuramoyl-L-alanyl-D-glutamate--2,6-diaminopimelate ligase
MSIGIAYALGIKQDVIQDGVRRSKPVAGRFENVNEGQNFLCIVDYAHTEDALRKVIEEARYITRGRIITVFGCGGDRDRTKRPLMAAAAYELSDIVVITSDNPRSEDPSAIIRDIESGIGTKNHISLQDREEAINEAVAMAQEGDTVLIAGKGHETYQEIQGVRYHFSDREILGTAIRKRLAVSG